MTFTTIKKSLKTVYTTKNVFERNDDLRPGFPYCSRGDLKFDHLMRRADSLEKTLLLGKIEGTRKRGWQKMRQLHSIINSMDMSLSKLQEIVKDRESWCVAVHGATKSQTRLSDWTTTQVGGWDWNVQLSSRCCWFPWEPALVTELHLNSKGFRVLCQEWGQRPHIFLIINCIKK